MQSKKTGSSGTVNLFDACKGFAIVCSAVLSAGLGGPQAVCVALMVVIALHAFVR